MTVKYLGSTQNGTQYKAESGIDYTGVYEDILDMEDRAKADDGLEDDNAFREFVFECVSFRSDIILQTRTLVAWA